MLRSFLKNQPTNEEQSTESAQCDSALCIIQNIKNQALSRFLRARY